MYFENGQNNNDYYNNYDNMNVPNKKNSNKKIVLSIIGVILLVAIFFCSGVLGFYIGVKSEKVTNLENDLLLTGKIYDMINKYYYKDIDKEEFDKYAALGISQIMDQYSGLEIVSSVPQKSFGLQMTRDGYNNHYIVDIVAGSPAYLASGVKVNSSGNILDSEVKYKLQRGDKLISCNGKSLVGIDDNLLNDKSLFGSDKIELIVQKNNGDYAKFNFEKSLLYYSNESQDKNYYSSACDYYDLGSNVSMIRLKTFATENANDFEKCALKFKNSPNQKLILDLRGNGGGSLSVLSTIATYFIEENGKSGGLPINRIVDKNGVENIFKSDSETSTRYYFGRDKQDYQLVVLIDGGSASASEALIGAIKYYDESAVFIGSGTYGKGIAQGVFPVSGYNLMLHITIGYFDVPLRVDGKMTWANFHEKPYMPTDTTSNFTVPTIDMLDKDLDMQNYFANDIKNELAVQKALQYLSK